MKINLLRDPMFLVETCTGRRQADLPGVIAGLAKGEIVDFPRMRPHQAPYFHMFLCQLAAMALEKRGLTRPDDIPADDWRRMILDLTPAFPDAEPWDLVGADETRPAFLQPPVVKGSKDGKSPAIHATPDSIDLISTTRAHAQKAGHSASEPEHWVHALICRQTAGGYYGKFNYGVMRAPGNDHPRFLVGLVPSLNPSDRFRRDTAGLIAVKSETLAAAPFLDAAHRRPLLWTEGWDGDAQLPPTAVGPWSIEAGLRLRLVLCEDGGGAPRIACERRMNSGRRISEGTGKTASLIGRLGDPWGLIYVPLNGSAQLEGGRPSFEWVARLLFDETTYRLPPLARRIPKVDGDRPLWLRIEGMHAKDGKTSWCEKTVSVPLKGRFSFGRESLPVALDMLADLALIHEKILMPAMLAWFDAEDMAKASAAEIKRTCYPILRDEFSARAEDSFFACAAECGTDAQGALVRWRDAARSAVIQAYEAFLEAMPAREDSSRRRRARGLGALRSLLFHHLAAGTIPKSEGQSDRNAQTMNTQTRRQQIEAATSRIIALVANSAIVSPAQFAQIESFDTHTIGPRVPTIFWKILGHAMPTTAQGELDGRERLAWLAVVKAAAIASKVGGKPLPLGQALQEARVSQIRYDHIMAAESEDRRLALDAALTQMANRGIAFSVKDVAFLLLLEGADVDAEIERIDRDYMRSEAIEAA